jgi:hypothetical protein
MVKFQILIPTMPGREAMLLRLIKLIEPQIARHQAASYFIDPGEGSIGVKRQRMIEKATADYIAFVDDDDVAFFFETYSAFEKALEERLIANILWEDMSDDELAEWVERVSHEEPTFPMAEDQE